MSNSTCTVFSEWHLKVMTQGDTKQNLVNVIIFFIFFLQRSIIPDAKKRTKLFGTSLKQQIDDSGREIPDVVESCAKYIAKYGS